jgi:uncharacterized protein YdhG (YjbR/CyaY superfamily)
MSKKIGIEANTVDEYLMQVPENARFVLQKLREKIKSLIPPCRERVSYKIPIIALAYDLIGFSYQVNHCSLHTMSPQLMKRLKEQLTDFHISGATVHFQPEKPLPDSLIKLIVISRLKELADRSAKKRAANKKGSS